MAALTSAPFVAFCTCTWMFVVASEELKEVKVKLGGDAILSCQVSTGSAIKAFEWNRPDLETDGYVFFYEKDASQDKYQHPLFHGRVELEHKPIRDGDVSVVLKNITQADAGNYDCLVSLKTTGRGKRDLPERMQTITLKVEEPGYREKPTWDTEVSSGGHKNEHVGRAVSLSVGLFLVLSIL